MKKTKWARKDFAKLNEVCPKSMYYSPPHCQQAQGPRLLVRFQAFEVLISIEKVVSFLFTQLIPNLFFVLEAAADVRNYLKVATPSAVKFDRNKMFM